MFVLGFLAVSQKSLIHDMPRAESKQLKNKGSLKRGSHLKTGPPPKLQRKGSWQVKFSEKHQKEPEEHYEKPGWDPQRAETSLWHACQNPEDSWKNFANATCAVFQQL